MPPASPSYSQQNDSHDESPLSDEGAPPFIITAAGEDSNVHRHPFRSIFSAYDTVLAQNGIDPDHDQIYLRFLLRLGGARTTGKTLYESFESLLAELGIQIEINTEENEIQDVTRSFSAAVENSINRHTRSEAESDSGVRSRRASFHSMADGEAEGGRHNGLRSSSRASVAARQRGKTRDSRERPSTRATLRPSERLEQPPRHSAVQPARGRLTAKEFAGNLQHYQRRHASASNTRTSAQYGRQILEHDARAHSGYQPNPYNEQGPPSISPDSREIFNDNRQDIEVEGHENRFTGHHEEAYRTDPRELFYQPTDTQLLRDAEAFQHIRLRAVLIKVLNSWHARTWNHRDAQDRMNYVARTHDAGILLRQSFDIWRGNAQSKVQNAANERYYHQQEERAYRARDLYLMTKAFTHWYQVVRERIKFAVEARKQILRVKYFSAWLELTVGNQYQVQRHRQRKFLLHWKQRSLNAVGSSSKASLTRDHSLLKAGYWKWFWSFCERRAPQWHDTRLRGSAFSHWYISSRQRIYHTYNVHVQRDERVKKKCFSDWLQKTRVVRSQAKKADSFNRQRTTERSILTCRRAIRYAPVSRQVSNMADWRIAGCTFAILVKRIRTEKQAQKVDQLRVMRKAWTTWNDCLRWQTLENQIDDRVLVQALYRWVLAERCALQQRLRQQRHVRGCFHRLVQRGREQASKQGGIVREFEKARQARLVKTIFGRWHDSADARHQDGQIAFEFEAPRIGHGAITAWTARVTHVKKLESWATDASYYFCTVRFLKQWRAASAESKRRKVHEAYVQVRRQNKMKLAAGCLETWRNRTNTVVDMHNHAQSHGQQQLVQYATRLFDHWRNRYYFLTDRQDQTTTDLAQRLVHDQLDKWITRRREQGRLEELASVNAELRIANIALGWLHKLHLRMIELKGRESNAESFRRLYTKRRFHNLLRHWHGKVAKRQDQPLPPPAFSSRARRVGKRPEGEGQDDVANGAAERTDFDEDFDLGEWIPAMEAQASSTPLPGYLSTPSKRAARARGLVRMSTTPIGTPFAARLRSQLSRQPQSVRRGDFARSVARFNDSTFGTVPETLPRTPDTHLRRIVTRDEESKACIGFQFNKNNANVQIVLFILLCDFSQASRACIGEALAIPHPPFSIAPMRALLPGKPQARLQAVSTVRWENVYISGNALIILGGPHDLLQTIYVQESCALNAVAIDDVSGKIAAASTEEIYVYRPYGKEEGLLKWSLQCTIPRDENVPDHVTLSWGTDEELLVGSDALRLFQVATEETEIWCRKLSKPAKLADFSPDASLIASTGHYDRLIKLWKRQSSGADDTRFDYTYLPHPTAVTAMHWRKHRGHEHTPCHVLFSVCGDQKVRIWAATDPHGVQGLQLWADIDMQSSIQPRQLKSNPDSEDRFAFFISSEDFAYATEAAVRKVPDPESQQRQALDHLVEVAKSNPDLCVVLDRHGHMSAWGLENVGSKVKRATDVFNIAHVENFTLAFSEPGRSTDDDTQFSSFCYEHSGAPFTLLAHHLDGRIEWIECKLDELFDPTPQQERIHRRSLWTGHDSSIRKIVRSISGKVVLSRTNDNEAILWRQGHGDSDLGLARCSLLESSDHIRRTWVLNEGDFIVNLHHQSISLWDTRTSSAVRVASLPFSVADQLICLVQLPKTNLESTVVHLAGVTSEKEGLIFSVSLPGSPNGAKKSQDSTLPSITRFCDISLDIQDDLAFMLPVDPAGSKSWASGSVDTFARDIAISYSTTGRLRTWTAAVNTAEDSAEWLVTSTVETGINSPSLASASSTRKAALVDTSKTGLTIWDMRSGQLEHDVQYDSLDVVGDLDWSSTPDDQSLLAVGFSHRVVVLAQMRYDYMSVGPAWAPIREIHIKDSTPHPIGDSTWLGNGNLLIGAGNQLFLYDKVVNSSDSMVSDLEVPVHRQGRMDLFEVVTYLNGPLPVFHPQFLSQCVLTGKMGCVQKVILGLHQGLKFFTEGDALDSFVSMSPTDFIEDEQSHLATNNKRPSGVATFENGEELDLAEVALSLTEKMTKTSIPQLSSREQLDLVDMIECISTVNKHRRSMDDNALRFLLFFRQHMIRKNQTSADSDGITFREIVWAFHSGSQDILVDQVSRQFQGRMLWEHAKESGMFMWMTDLTALRTQFEVIARNEYTKTDEKNPIDCSLYYLALKKKSVLVGLWRMAAWNREQASTQRLLSNNFQEARWKTAALKNAYALLGKRRFEYAAAFFLLAGNLQDAVNVCLHQMRDLQLAVAVARVYEGDDGLVLRTLLEDKVLPQAAVEGNRWLATWAFWLLGKRALAVQSLIMPLTALVDAGGAPKMQARSYLANDPALVVLYKQLRGKTLQTLKGASSITPKAEWDFVIQNARLYDRMGCDLLALDLVRNWEFLIQPKELPAQDVPPDPRKLLRRRSSLVVDDLSSPKSPTGMKSGIGKPPPQKVFEEPEANSLLDSFGF
ncbi:MAG: hypothetical protein Q9174_001119 [Haloplaca sp. 1 TL-2023]